MNAIRWCHISCAEILLKEGNADPTLFSPYSAESAFTFAEKIQHYVHLGMTEEEGEEEEDEASKLQQLEERRKQSQMVLDMLETAVAKMQKTTLQS
jgi:hypothetical protein